MRCFNKTLIYQFSLLCCLTKLLYSCEKEKPFKVEEFVHYKEYEKRYVKDSSSIDYFKIFLISNPPKDHKEILAKLDSVTNIEIPNIKFNPKVNSITHSFYVSFDNFWDGKFDKKFKENKREMFGESIGNVQWYFRNDGTIEKGVFINNDSIWIKTKLNSNYEKITPKSRIYLQQ